MGEHNGVKSIAIVQAVARFEVIAGCAHLLQLTTRAKVTIHWIALDIIHQNRPQVRVGTRFLNLKSRQP